MNRLTNQPKILFLLVNYFNEKEVCAFVNEQLQPNANIFIDVIIIDNGSKETTLLTELANNYANVSLVNSVSNLGYFGAANIGLTNYLNKHNGYPDVVIVCNTDMILQSKFLETLRQKITTQNFDIMGPSIHSSLLNYYQNPYIINRISKGKLKFLHFVSSSYILYSLFTIYHLLKTKLMGRQNSELNFVANPYALHGSFMIFNKTFFEKGGTINYPSVLFGEELFIAEQAQKLNLNMVYEPTLQVEHNEHATTGVFKSRKTVAYLHQSYTYLLKTYFSR
ncbi:MAG TPA: glycosyltransferase [Bacteroidia bacterium]|nr:glycosyltransferase [Bacteroidia bacterium]